LRELKDFKASKIAEEKKAKKLEKKAKRKARKHEIRSLSKAMDRLAVKSSESEPGIKELFNNQLVEEDPANQVDENRNHKSAQDEKVLEEINCTMCAVIIPNYTPDYFHGIEINPACQNCSPKDLNTFKQVSSFEDTVSISSSNSQAAAEATFTECSEISTIKTNQGFPPTRPFPPIKPFPPLGNF
jgi:hypothetical protein